MKNQKGKKVKKVTPKVNCTKYGVQGNGCASCAMIGSSGPAEFFCTNGEFCVKNS